ncbi:hypothetical protein H4R20_000419 [Coemansia guatemalensis]|uniref:Arrestin-like N-terminal domain-containing protein n=1 Tax=Coemansia guatemalensis TaxID=2761395 RepID=A0A9W8I1H1_9FUNG|nr:hypothetical protein H4R20_000419 [Coemansia guatemalensis]
MSIFSSISHGSAIRVRVHPRTTKVVLRQNADSSNVLVGYVSVEVQRTTEITRLAVKFTGAQHLDMRDGQGPSSSLFSVRHQCAQLTHTLVECSATSSADSMSAAMAIERARVRRRRSSEDSGWSSMAELNTYVEEDSSGHRALELMSFSSAGAVSLGPGEYRFPFELALPARLPVSVASAMGKVAYHVEAEVQRAARMFHSAVTSDAVEIRVQQEPRLAGGRTANPMLLGFPSFQTLATTPLHFETTVAAGQWKISVCSASSRALCVGMPLKLRMYATRSGGNSSSSQDVATDNGLAIMEFSMSLHESITHAVPGSTAAPQTTDRVVATSSLCPWNSSKKERQHSSAATAQVLDPQTVDALGESFDELPSVGSLTLDLAAKGRHAVQPSSASPMFTVSHKLRMKVAVCECCADGSIDACTAPARVSCSTAVVVLPEPLGAVDSAACTPLPCYGSIARDVVLAASSEAASAVPAPMCDASAASSSPPAYASLYR